MEGAVSLEKLYDELKKIEKEMVTKKEIESLKDSLAILSNPQTMKQIAESMEDIKKGKVKEINSVNDLIKDL